MPHTPFFSQHTSRFPSPRVLTRTQSLTQGNASSRSSLRVCSACSCGSPARASPKPTSSIRTTGVRPSTSAGSSTRPSYSTSVPFTDSGKSNLRFPDCPPRRIRPPSHPPLPTPPPNPPPTPLVLSIRVNTHPVLPLVHERIPLRIPPPVFLDEQQRRPLPEALERRVHRAAKVSRRSRGDAQGERGGARTAQRRRSHRATRR